MQKKFTPANILLAFILLNLIIGWWIAPDFGRTPDEGLEYLRTTAALKAYSPGSFGHYSDNDIPLTARFYGTAMTMLAQLAENNFQPLLLTEPGAVLHYVYFLFFQIAVVATFYLTKKFTSDWTALSIAVLFGTQPLYFGHAFFNPKDTPLLAIFLAAVTVGIYMSDRLIAITEDDPPPSSGKITWQTLPAPAKKKLLTWQMVWPVLLGAYLLASRLLPTLVTMLYQANANTFWGQLFARIAPSENRAALSQYIEKATQLTNRAFIGATLVGAVWMLILAIQMIPQWQEQLKTRWLMPIRQDLSLKRLAVTVGNLSLLAAGFLWGWAIATRVVGIFAGGIVGVYLLIRGRGRAVLALVVYTITAALTAFLAFPQLWQGGLTKMVRGLSLFSSFLWDSQVLYQGTTYAASELPRSYLPFFLSTQFTEPLILLAALGFLVGVIQIVRHQSISWERFLVISLWFILPLSYVLVKHPALYNNCRQFLFITPPLFVFAAIGLEATLKRIHQTAWQGVLMIAILIPGLVSLVQLHPYQYIYYNTFVGGVEGAFRTYETDYWGVSATEAIKEINRIAPENAEVILWAPAASVTLSARPDLQLIPQKEITRDIATYDYALITSQFNADQSNLTNRPAIYTIARGDVLLAVVKAIHAGE